MLNRAFENFWDSDRKMDRDSPDVFHLPPFIWGVVPGSFLASEIAARKFFKSDSNKLEWMMRQLEGDEQWVRLIAVG